ncbi:hypothetical protein SESBI_20613 [Sesbania bispinosa]|nr:hypothetical protein SESBI_20613 [Sesbania bispinosa]
MCTVWGVYLLEVLIRRAPSLQYPSPACPRMDEEEQVVDLSKCVRLVVKEKWTAAKWMKNSSATKWMKIWDEG